MLARPPLPCVARRTVRRARGATLAVVAALALAGCSSSAPARLDTLAASDHPLLSATPTPDPTFEPLDDEHASVGELADGFPTDLVPLPGDADILVSSVQPSADGAFTEISLNLRTTLSAQDLMNSLPPRSPGRGSRSPLSRHRPRGWPRRRRSCARRARSSRWPCSTATGSGRSRSGAASRSPRLPG